MLDAYEGTRKAATKCINELLEKLEDPTYGALGGYEDYALRELATHLRQLKLDGTAFRLLAYHKDHVQKSMDWFLSDYAMRLDDQAIKELESEVGQFPLPLTDPAEQAEVQETRRRLILQNLKKFEDRLRSLRTELLEVRTKEDTSMDDLLSDSVPSSLDLKELLRRVFKTKQRRDVRVVDRAFAIALRQPEGELNAADRKLLEDAVDGLLDVSFTGLFSGTVRYIINDDRFKSLVTPWHLQLAVNELRDDECRRLRIHSGKMYAWDFVVDRLGAAVAQRKRSLGGHGDRHNDEKYIGEYCWRLSMNTPLQRDAMEDHVNSLQLGGFTQELIQEILTYCPVEAEEMRLHSSNIATHREGLVSDPPETGGKNRVMTDGQKNLWRALKNCASSGKELANELDTSEDTVRQLIKELRAANYEIENRRGRGYFRPDAPPDDLKST